MRSLAIVGFGDIGERVVRRLPPSWRSVALRRRASEVPVGVRGVAADLGNPETLMALERLAPDALLVTLSPRERSAEAYRAGFTKAMANLLAGLGGHQPTRAFFVSSTRVYAEGGGEWIDETAALAVDRDHARAIIDAENLFLDALPGAFVLRAGGLYGHGPGPLLRSVAAGRLRPIDTPIFGNRIHREDAAGFIAHALETEPPDRVINLVDDGCVPLQEVEAWLCDRLRLPYEPPARSDSTAVPTHKRIRNARLHRSGYRLQYPDYRTGYAQVLRQWIEHSEREDGLDLH